MTPKQLAAFLPYVVDNRAHGGYVGRIFDPIAAFNDQDVAIDYAKQAAQDNRGADYQVRHNGLIVWRPVGQRA